MKRLEAIAVRLLETLVTLLLAAMVVMVFGNVVLRYAFNSGIHASDELSRYAFVWLTFLGAILTFRDNAHVNIETLVVRLPRHWRLACMAATQVVVLICAAAMFLGTLALRPLNVDMKAPVTAVPMNWVSDVGLIAALGFALIAAVRLARILAGRVSEAEIEAFVGTHGSEGRE